MLDFKPVYKKEITMHELCGGLTRDELRDLTHEMIDTMLALIADCGDEDVTFVYDDPKAFDDFAATADEVDMAWTLGHVIVHTTASAEESAFLAAEMARGVERKGRSRSEVDWRTVTTIEQCRHRLEESRRMRLASLEMWPDQPHMDNTTTVGFMDGPINPATRFALGLSHDSDHLGQIEEIVRQAHKVRSEQLFEDR